MQFISKILTEIPEELKKMFEGVNLDRELMLWIISIIITIIIPLFIWYYQYVYYPKHNPREVKIDKIIKEIIKDIKEELKNEKKALKKILKNKKEIFKGNIIDKKKFHDILRDYNIDDERILDYYQKIEDKFKEEIK